jgi:cytoskeleton protein RodZ
MSEGVHDASAGTLLRRAREASGMHVAALAVSLKVPVRKLEALERDQYDQLPDAVFARALASSICRTLKVDPQPVLARLPQTAAPRLAQTQDSINAPFRVPGEAAGSGWRDQLRRPVVVTVVALLIGALVIIFMPDLQQRGQGTAVAPKAEAAGAPMAAPVVLQPSSEIAPATGAVAGSTLAAPAVAGAPGTSGLASTPGDPAAAAATAAAPAVPVQTPSPAGSATLPAPATAAVVASTAAAAPAADPAGVLVFRANGPSWIQVTDAKGVVALRRQLEAGETTGVTGALPLAVTVGSAGATSVQVRGKAFDLAPVTRDNVARFEVK